MTERLYYLDSFLREFDARVLAVNERGAVLDRTAFYPTSGGQPYDTGRLGGAQVVDVIEDESTGDIVHAFRAAPEFQVGDTIRGEIDLTRRLDHIQQHTGQHVLSAVFVRLFNYATVSFHLGADSSTIDLAAQSVTPEQARRAEEMGNEIIFEDRPLRVFLASPEEARALPLRKDVAREGELRLVEIPDLDLSACGGTHAARTGQVGCVLIRKVEKVRQGTRVEFICGLRAVRAARTDYIALAEAAGALTTHPHQLAAGVKRQAEELKAAEKERLRLLTALAGYEARELYAATPEVDGVRQIVKIFDNADPAYVRTLASQFAAQPNARALFALKEPPTVMLAQSRGASTDLGGLIKSIVGEFGLRGGGSRDSAQAGAADVESALRALEAIRVKLTQ